MPSKGHRKGEKNLTIKGDAKEAVREDKNRNGKREGISSEKQMLIPLFTAELTCFDKNGSVNKIHSIKIKGSTVKSFFIKSLLLYLYVGHTVIRRTLLHKI
ncbi:MAG: hypothetical protein Q4G23_00890 [Clostridia bacterium]|nr:hypothetical protein [Clostridia bacterium]